MRILLLVSLVAACDVESLELPVDAGAPPDAPPLTRTDFIERFATTYCAKVASCCERPDWATTECREELSDDLWWSVPSSMNLEAAAACLDGVDALTCDTTNEHRWFSGLFIGAAEEACGHALLIDPHGCVGSADDGRSCADGVCQAGVCVPRRGNGESCCLTVGCGSGLCGVESYCDLGGFVCLPDRNIGEACAASRECGSLRCLNGRCAPATLESVECPEES